MHENLLENNDYFSESLVYIFDMYTNELYFANDAMLSELKKIGITEKESKNSASRVIENFLPKIEHDIEKLKAQKSAYFEGYNKLFDKWYSVKSEYINYENKDCIIEIVTDISYTQTLKKELEERTNSEKLLEKCSNLLCQNASPEESVLQTLKLFADYYKAEKAQIFKITDDGTDILETLDWCEGGICSIKSRLERMPVSVFLKNIGENQVVICDMENIQEQIKQINPDFVNIEDRKNIKIVISAVKNHLNKIVGFICIYNPKINTKNTEIIVSISRFVVEFLQKNKFIDSLHQLSYYDVLTGLKNHYSYREKIKEFENRKPETLGVIYIDINGLKAVNNTKGHAYGDELIMKISEVLQKYFGKNAYRVDGNEFVVLHENIEENVFEDLVGQAKKHFNINESISVSVGYSWNRSACCENCSKNIANSIWNTGENFETIDYHNFLIENLKREIVNDRFKVYFQPQISLKTDKIIGAETLIRKYDSYGNMLSPFFFIPFYEKQGIISPVDFFVFEQVCKFLQKNQCENIKMSVNFSRVTFAEPCVVKKVKAICEYYKVNPKQITIEITETIQGINEGVLVEIMNEFLNNGFTLSLDDFGSGYSNMSLIASSNFTEIKIDKSLVDGIVSNKKSKILTDLVINACVEFNSETVAEGIETKEQLDLLKKMGCQIGQGYYFDKPLCEEDFIQKYM